MKTLTLLAAWLVAFPLFAAETKPQEKPKSEAQKSEPVKLDAQPQGDSPLVAAAKSTNRSGKKRIVITDQTLKKSGGHVTTTTISSTVNVPPPMQPPEVYLHNVAMKQKAEAADKAARERQAEAEKQKRLQALAAIGEESSLYSDVDPAQQEQALDNTTKTPPKQEQKKP